MTKRASPTSCTDRHSGGRKPRLGLSCAQPQRQDSRNLRPDGPSGPPLALFESGASLCCEARPTRAAVGVVHRSEQRLARGDIHVDAWLLVVPICICVVEWPFRSVTLCHAVLLGRKTGYSIWIFVVLRHISRMLFRSRMLIPASHHASIHRQYGSRDPGAFVRRQEEDGFCYVRRLPNPA